MGIMDVNHVKICLLLKSYDNLGPFYEFSPKRYPAAFALLLWVHMHLSNKRYGGARTVIVFGLPNARCRGT